MELRVNGTTIFCEVVGEGRPCVCLHGGPGTDASGLARTLAPLAGELGLRLIFYDHRGHGRSEWVPVEQCTQDQLVADIEGVRAALGLGPVHVLGISWGGFLGLMYAARHQASVRALAVVGAAASRDFMPRARRTVAPWRTAPCAPTSATGSPCAGSSSSTSTPATTAGPSSRGSPARPWSRSGATTGSVRWTRPRRSRASSPGPSSRSSSRAATRRRSKSVRPSRAGSPPSWEHRPPRADAYFPVQRTL